MVELPTTSAGGSADSLARFSREDFCDRHQRHLCPGNVPGAPPWIPGTPGRGGSLLHPESRVVHVLYGLERRSDGQCHPCGGRHNHGTQRCSTWSDSLLHRAADRCAVPGWLDRGWPRVAISDRGGVRCLDVRPQRPDRVLPHRAACNVAPRRRREPGHRQLRCHKRLDPRAGCGEPAIPVRALEQHDDYDAARRRPGWQLRHRRRLYRHQPGRDGLLGGADHDHVVECRWWIHVHRQCHVDLVVQQLLVVE
jgi:hypothetical protein